MPPRKHITPSRKRYVRENPTVSIRLTKNLKELLDKVRRGASYSQFFKDLIWKEKGRIVRSYIEGLKEGRKKGQKVGYDEGFNEGKEDWEIWFHCSVCREPITIDQDSDVHKEVIQYLLENGWGHSECLNPGKQ